MTTKELESTVNDLRTKVNNLSEQLKKASENLLSMIAVRVLATFGMTTFDEEKKWTITEQRPGFMSRKWSDEYRAWRLSTSEAISKISDVLIRLALAEKCKLTSLGDGGHFCCPDDNPRPYLDFMSELNLRELVVRGSDQWHITEEKFKEAHKRLIEVCSVPEELSEVTRIQGEIDTLQAELNQHASVLVKNREEEKYTQKLGGQVVSEQAKAFIVDLLKRGVESITVANPDVFLWLTSRSEYGNSGGCGYFDQVHAYYYGQTKMVEYQWRDRYSADRDKPWLKVNGLENATATLEGTNATVKVTLVNIDGKRSEQFAFEHKEVPAIVELTTEEQTAFNQKVATAIEAVMSQLEDLWHLKPQMIGVHGYMPYRRPSVKQNVTRANLGVAAFVTEEQIDHCGSDPQTRYELFVMTHKDATPKMVIEDHGYEKREGSNIVTIVELNQDSVLINTRNGKRTLKL